MFLQEIDLIFMNQKSIKQQVIVNYLVNAPSNDTPLMKNFQMSMIFAKNKIIYKSYSLMAPSTQITYKSYSLMTPSTPMAQEKELSLFHHIMPQSPWHSSSFLVCTNNIVECESLLLGIKATITIKMKKIRIIKDLQLVVNRAKEGNNTKDKMLIPYKEMVSNLLQHSDEYEIENIASNNTSMPMYKKSQLLLEENYQCTKTCLQKKCRM